MRNRRAVFFGPLGLDRQVEYYLSDENLKYDKFFHEKIAENKDGWLEPWRKMRETLEDGHAHGFATVLLAKLCFFFIGEVLTAPEDLTLILQCNKMKTMRATKVRSPGRHGKGAMVICELPHRSICV